MSAYVFSHADLPEDLIGRHVRANCAICGPKKYTEEIEACFALTYRLIKELRGRVTAVEAQLERAVSPTGPA